MSSATAASSSDAAQSATLVGLRRAIIAEMLGTYMLVFFGCGSVHAAVLLGAQSGVWQVAIVWGVAVMLAIYAVGGVSGAHINPAMTMAMAVWGRHPWSRVAPYILAQLAGAVFAAATLFFLFNGFLTAKEEEKQLFRGDPGSVITAMCYGEFFPNPGSLASADGPYDPAKHAKLRERFPESAAFATEFVATLLLALVVFASTDERNPGRPPNGLAPVFIGLTVAGLISVVGPLTQACLNPARDFGPRMFTYFAGWGAAAWPGFGQTWWWSVYIVAPILGAIAGGAVYHGLIRPQPTS